MEGREIGDIRKEREVWRRINKQGKRKRMRSCKREKEKKIE